MLEKIIPNLKILLSFLLIICQYVILQHKAFAQQTNTALVYPYYLDQQGYLYFNIHDQSQDIIATRLDLKIIYPQVSIRDFNRLSYQFQKDKILITSYQGPHYMVEPSVNLEDKSIVTAKYYKVDNQALKVIHTLHLESEQISLKQLQDYDFLQNFPMKNNQLSINHLLFYAAKYGHHNVYDLIHVTIYNMLKDTTQDNYPRVKQLYFSLLQTDPGFNENRIIMEAVLRKDLAFIKQMRLQNLNEPSLVDADPHTYHFYKCTPLGQAIRTKQLDIAEYLLSRTAKMNDICGSTYRKRLYSALELAEVNKDKKMIKLIEAYVKNSTEQP